MEADVKTKLDALVGSLDTADTVAWQELGAKLGEAAPTTAKKPFAKAAKKAAAGLPVDLPTSSRLWYIAVGTFAFVMIVAVIGLTVGVFMKGSEVPMVKSEVLLAIFTASVGFLGGVFVPSPVEK